MTDTNGNGSGPTGAPALNVLVQYVKDLSFENPNAPRSLQPRENPPEIGIQVNVNAKQLSPNDFEVSVTLEASATEGGEVLFKLEVDYGGVFRLVNIPAEQIHPLVMIECPRLLFPFLRQVVADGTRNGGFPPLYVDPIDFFALYQQRAAQAEQQTPANAN